MVKPKLRIALGGWEDGRLNGWMDGKVQKLGHCFCTQKNQGTGDSGWNWKDGWVGEWMDGWMDGKAGLRIAYSNQKLSSKFQGRDIQNDQLWKGTPLSQVKYGEIGLIFVATPK